MIQITPHIDVFICSKPIDFRMQFDGLGGVCRSVLKLDPLSGAMIVFINKKRTAIKILVYDGQGLWVMAKRLSKGSFSWWPNSAEECVKLDAKNLLILIWNGEVDSIKLGEDWKKL